MDDRQALLAAIADQPGEDTPRLILADWLEEFGTTDQDAARIEYIRLSCGVGYGGDQGRSKVRLGVNEGKWLDANWKRLVPKLVACATPELWLPRTHSEESNLVDYAAGGITAKRSGRKMSVRLWWRWDSRYKSMVSRYSGITIYLWFWRGFLERLDAYSVNQLYLVGGIVAQDDPLTRVRLIDQRIPWDRHNYTQILLGTVSESGIGPLLPFVKQFDYYRKVHPLTNTEAKFFEPRLARGETEEECFGRAHDAINAAANEWMRCAEGVSIRTSRGGAGNTYYEPVKLPLNDAAPWPDAPPRLDQTSLFGTRVQ